MKFLRVCAALALALSMATPANASPRVNNPHCQPTGAAQEPVVLIHGSFNTAKAWEKTIPALTHQGMCVWAFDYGAEDDSFLSIVPGVKGIADMNRSGREVAHQIDYVRRVTGSQKVNLVGHSQGAAHVKQYIERFGSPENVARAVTLGGNVHGTTMGGKARLIDTVRDYALEPARFTFSTAAVQQVTGSHFMEALNALPDTSAGVSYVSIYTPVDDTVTPSSASRLAAVPGADVVNLNIRSVCGVAPGHAELPADPTTISQVVWALQRQPGEQPSPNHCWKDRAMSSMAATLPTS